MSPAPSGRQGRGRPAPGSGGGTRRIASRQGTGEAAPRGRREGDGSGGRQVEGRQAVRELLRAGRRPVRQVFMVGDAHHESLAEIADLAGRAGVPVRPVSRDRLEAMAATEAPQGVIAIAAAVADRPLGELLTGPPDGPAPFLVVLDGVTDPRNVGAVMRSALSAGATALVVGRHRSGHLTPAAVKAAAGAVEHLPVATVAGIPAALVEMAGAGVWTVGLDSHGGTSLWDLAVASEPVAVVLGAEGRGLSPLVRRRCDVLAAVPMAGPLDSLNVSAAAALACFEVSRRRSATTERGN